MMCKDCDKDPCCCGKYDQTDRSPAGKPQKFVKEHSTLVSRTTGRKIEIEFGPLPGSLVSKNPFASLAQEGYLHAHPEKLGTEKLKEFDAATKGKKLPKRVKK